MVRDNLMEEAELVRSAASIVKSCQPTPSQEPNLQFCPMASESSQSLAGFSTSSTDTAPSEPTGIVMLTLPDTAEEDDAVFHTPPEHQFRSSADDQNILDTKKVTVSEEGSGDEGRLERARVAQEAELAGDENPKNTDVTGIGGEESGEGTVDLGDDDGVKVDGTDGGGEGAAVVNDSACKDHESNENGENKEGDEGDAERICVETREDCTVVRSEEVVKVAEDVEVCKDAAIEDEGLGTVLKSIDKIDEFRFVGEKDGERMPKVRKGKDVKRRSKERTGKDGDCGAGKKRQLPLSIKGKEKSAEVSHRAQQIISPKGKRKNAEGSDRVLETVSPKGKEKNAEGSDRVQETVLAKGKVKNAEGSARVQETTKSGLLEMLELLKMVVGNKNDSSEPVDLVETAKKRGVVFPRPRWWPLEGEDF